MNPADTAFVLVSAALVMLMTPGLALFYGGMVRSKNILATLMENFIMLGVVGVIWALWGYSLAFGPDHGGVIGGLSWAGLQGVGVDPNPDYAAMVEALDTNVGRVLDALDELGLAGRFAVDEDVTTDAKRIFFLPRAIVCKDEEKGGAPGEPSRRHPGRQAGPPRPGRRFRHPADRRPQPRHRLPVSQSPVAPGLPVP